MNFEEKILFGIQVVDDWRDLEGCTGELQIMLDSVAITTYNTVIQLSDPKQVNLIINSSILAAFQLGRQSMREEK